MKKLWILFVISCFLFMVGCEIPTMEPSESQEQENEQENEYESDRDEQENEESDD